MVLALSPASCSPTWLVVGIQDCIRQHADQGLFERPFSESIGGDRPTLQSLELHILQLLALATSTTMIEAALRGICRTKLDAAVVTESIQLLLDRATRQARGVILKYITYGPIGLLVHSEASHVDELLFLERHRAHIVALSSQPLLVIGMLRADIQALIPVLQRVNPRLWQQSLLHEPVGSHNRRRYQKQLHPAFHSQIVGVLAEERQYTLADAERLFAILVTERVEGLIDWRCQLDPATAHATLAAQRIKHAMNQPFVSSDT